MHNVAVLGANPVADYMARLARLIGANVVAQFGDPAASAEYPGGVTLGANQTRLLLAAGLKEALFELAHQPDREQIRLAPSGYLLAELPLGRFYHERYNAPMLNLSQQALGDLLTNEAVAPVPDLRALEQQYDVVINADPNIDCHTDANCTLHCSYAPGQPERANVTWLAEHAVCWQFSDPAGTHFLFYGDLHAPWPETLRIQAERATAWTPLCGPPRAAAEWVQGTLTHLGPACMPVHPIRRETWFTGFEDAWVLSRMLENYEEDVADALREYVRFREPRARRIQRFNDGMAADYLQTGGIKRWLRNVGIAGRSRFLPEIAMQRADWLYGYDCIRGFR